MKSEKIVSIDKPPAQPQPPSVIVPQPINKQQAHFRPNIVNWKWITIDPFLFPNISVPCLIRSNDSIKEYVSVRIIENSVLSNFESQLSQEAKQFGNLTTYFCSQEEIDLLNDINLNHVDKLYGSVPFKVDKDSLVGLEQFSKFYEIVKRTVPLKNSKNQRHIQPQPQIKTIYENQQYQPQTYQNVYQQFSNYPYRHPYPDPRMVSRVLTPNFSNGPPQFINYPTPLVNQQIIQLIPQAQVKPVQATPQIHYRPINPMLVYQVPNNVQQAKIRPTITTTINVNVPSIVNRNLTPPLTPLPIQTQTNEPKKQKSQEQLNQQPQKSVQSDQSSDDKQQDIEIDYDDQYGFIQANDKILFTIELQDSYYRFQKNFPKCHKYVPLNHLISLNLLSKDDSKHLYIQKIPNQQKIKTILKWFNLKHKPHRLEILDTQEIELVNVLEYQFVVYTSRAIYFKNLYYLNKPGVKYCEYYKDLLNMTGGLVYIKNSSGKKSSDKNFTIRPFIKYGNKVLVPDSDDLILKQKYSKINFDQEKIIFDKNDFQCEKLNEFCKLQIFYACLKIDEKFLKFNTYFYDLSKWFEFFGDEFKFLCLFDERFPQQWLKDCAKFANRIRLGNPPNQVQEQTEQNQQSVYMSPQSDNEHVHDRVEEQVDNLIDQFVHDQVQELVEQEIQEQNTETTDEPIILSLAALDNESIEFTNEELTHRIRPRSYSQFFKPKKSDKIHNNCFKYAKYFNKRFSCTALDFITDGDYTKEDLVSEKSILLNIIDKEVSKRQEKQISMTRKSRKTTIDNPLPVKEEKIDTVNVEEQPVMDSIEPIATPIKMKRPKEFITKPCEFLLDSPSRSTSKQTKRKQSSRIVDEIYNKRARLIEQEKELRELEKDLDFVVPDDEVAKLTENEKFNYEKPKEVPKNLQIIEKTKDDLYSTDSFDLEYYLKKYKLKDCQVKVQRIELDKTKMTKVTQKPKQKKPVKKSSKKKQKPVSKCSSSSSLLSNSSVDSKIIKSVKPSQVLNQAKRSVAFKPIKVFRIESDDEDELPRLDI